MNSETIATASQQGGPFDPDNAETYARWRDWKLSVAPETASDLVVEVADPFQPTAAEKAALEDRLSRANMAFYVGPAVDAEVGKELIRALGRCFGLERLDSNMLADNDGITPLAVSEKGSRPNYIPYTNRPINWHTDGYYNLPERQIRGLMLHCVSDAEKGGENAVMDHEIAYILLREANPDFIRALMHPRAMTIPPNKEGGSEIREERTGPVFSVDPVDGALHMRYTARKRNIQWRDDATTREAVAYLESITQQGTEHVFRHRLMPGQGLVCNNVLHDRAGFEDGGAQGKTRLIYRARYFDRVAGTAPAGAWKG